MVALEISIQLVRVLFYTIVDVDGNSTDLCDLKIDGWVT